LKESIVKLIHVATTAISILFTSAWPVRAADPEAVKEIPVRTELHPIQTLTLSDSHFLKGEADGKPATISGEFRIAQGGAGRLPVVVLMHGSGGMGPNIEMWASEFNAMGISTFAIDGFTGRGLTSVSGNQALLGRLNFILDIYRALDILAQHPRADPSRIALMGLSRGGQAALYASLKRFHRMWNKSGIEFAAYVPFYPDCMTTFIDDTDVAGRPIRIFQGGADDYNPAAPCKAFVSRLRAAGHDVELTEYPNVWHSFDNPIGPELAVAKNSQTVRHCSIREEPQGLLINAATKEPFTYKDPCVEFDPHLGSNLAAAEDAKRSVKGLFRTLFKLE
jgi:dienelactone hydrolase